MGAGYFFHLSRWCLICVPVVCWYVPLVQGKASAFSARILRAARSRAAEGAKQTQPRLTEEVARAQKTYDVFICRPVGGSKAGRSPSLERDVQTPNGKNHQLTTGRIMPREKASRALARRGLKPTMTQERRRLRQQRAATNQQVAGSQLLRSISHGMPTRRASVRSRCEPTA